MAEYIDRTQLEPDCEWSEYVDGYISYSESQIERMEPADVIERSTMEILCNEYLSKCNCCDECCAETYCILNSLRTENRDCVNNLITYLTKRNIGESKEIE